MAKKYKKQEDNTNYSFLLKCMTALTAAAVVTAGVIAAVSLNCAAPATTAFAAATAFPFLPAIVPIAIVVLGLMCILPFLFGNNSTTVRTVTPTYGYGMNGFYTPYTPTAPRYHSHTDSVYTNNSHVHGHTNPPVYDSHTHGHTSAPPYDSHHHGHSADNQAQSHVHGHR